ncbi:MAG: hypothetical protein ACYC26_08890 [Phycisphaerales bacterium]
MASIEKLPNEWRKTNEAVPCAVYQISEIETVKKIIAMTHGLDAKAGRDNWVAIAKARHHREENAANEPGLDILEQYLKVGSNLTQNQKEHWGGDYPLSVLDDSMPKIAQRLAYTTTRDLASSYPKNTKHKTVIERILYDIGTQVLKFVNIRTGDFMAAYGHPAPLAQPAAGTTNATPISTTVIGPLGGVATQTAPSATSSPAPPAVTGTSLIAPARKTIAVGSNDPKSVTRRLKTFKPLGKNREKVVTLRDELIRMNLAKTPNAFCIVLRALFEVSAKAYCDDHAASAGPAYLKTDGESRKLADILQDVTTHITKNDKNKEKAKLLHGASADLASPNGLLSITSMNQLVHNPIFTIPSQQIPVLFNNIFPLVEEMSR